MRCAWCEREATAVYRAATACDAHAADLRDLETARGELVPRRIGWTTAAEDAHREIRDAVEARDARELRGERIDWTRPVEGWALW